MYFRQPGTLKIIVAGLIAFFVALCVPAPKPAKAQEDTRPVITVAVQQVVTSGTLEPMREQSNVGSRIFYSIYEPMIDMDRQGDLALKPGIMESWKRIDDKTIEFTLRKGVRFHNGDEMTSEDVVFSFGPERMWGGAKKEEAAQQAGQTGKLFQGEGAAVAKELPQEVPAIAKRLLPQFEKMEAVDKYTVRFHNKTPDTTLEGRLTRFGAEVISKRAFMEAENWGAWARKPVATGPYKIKEFKPDNVLVLEAHDAYWGGRPPIRELRFVVVPEIATRVNGLVSGQYDFITEVSPDQFAAVEKSPKHNVEGGWITNHRLTVFDKNHPQLKDPRMRRALSHAIDRKAIVDGLFLGKTSVPKGLQWEYYGPMFHADWEVPKYDLELARKLVKESGYNGEPIPYRVSNYYTNQIPTAQTLVEMWRAAGINVRIDMKENWGQIFATDTPRAIRDWSNSALFNDPVASIVAQHCQLGQQQQVGEWTNEEFNTLCTELETSTDQARRRAVLRRMLEIAEREDPAYTVLHRSMQYYGKRKDIEWKYSPTQSMDFRSGNFKMAGK